MAEYVDEFRGTDDLYYAEVTSDTLAEFATGAVKQLAPVAEISKSVATATDTKFYNNVPAITINAEGADTIILNVPALDLPTLADITGKGYDSTTGAFMDGEAKPKYFALGYRLGLTDGTYRYVWRYKGTFAIPDETSQTKNAGTDSNGQTLTYTGISTIHKFTNADNKTQKALVVDERDGLADVTNFFNQVTTCDTLATTAAVGHVSNIMTHVHNSNSAATAEIGGTYTETLTADDDYEITNVTVVMNGVDVTSSAWTSGTGTVSIASVTGDIVIVAVATASN